MKKVNSIFWLLCIGILGIYTEGCRLSPFDDVASEKGTSDWAVPLIDTEKSFNDIISGFDPKALVQIDPSGLVTLRYKGDFVAKNSLDFFKDWQNQRIPFLDSVMAVPFKLPQGVSVDSARVKRGTLAWLILPPEAVNVTLIAPELTLNGQPFRRTFRVDGLDGGSVDLAGWDFKPRNDSIFIYLLARRVSNGTPINLGLTGSFFQVSNFEASFVRGYFGNSIFDGERDTILIDFFEKWQSGSVKFENPKLTATLDNSFGVPVRAKMVVGEVQTLAGQKLQLQSPLVNGVNVNYPTINQVGQSKRTVITFDKTNSNIADIISANPVAIDYDIDGIMNPDSNRSIVGFLTDSSAFKFQVELEVPMHGAVKNFTLNDSFDIDLSKNINVSEAEFKILTDNKMPIDLSLQGYFTDKSGRVLDSLYAAQTPVLRGAPVGSDGLPTGITTTESFAKFSAEKFDRLKAATKIVVRYSFSTTNNGITPVKLVATQAVRVRIGVRFTYKK